MTRVAAVDCGTNSVRLLVAEASDGRLVDLSRRMEIVRLGEGVDRTGRLSPAALRRTFDALRRYAEEIRDLQVSAVRMVATSATRDAQNRDEFVTGVSAILDVPPEVLTGSAEAALSFTGATRELLRSNDRATPFLVVDIGGGSTEFVLGDRRPVAAESVDIGCVRMAERHFAHDPPTPSEVAAARRDVRSALEQVREAVPIAAAGTVVGLAGTVTTVAGMALGLPQYDPELIHHTAVSADAVREVSDRLLAMDRTQRAAVPVMHPGRVDVIAAGALVLREIVDALDGRDVVASEHDILDGIAWSLAGHPSLN